MKGLFFALLIIIVLVGVGWVAIGFFTAPQDNSVKVPSVKDAGVSLYIENTGGVIYTGDNIEVYGTVQGERTFVLNGYWEMSGHKFVYHDATVRLDEKIFGKIQMQKRTA